MLGRGLSRGIARAGPGRGSTAPNWRRRAGRDVSGAWKGGEEREVRYLNEVLLGPLVVHANARCVPREIAEQIVRFAGW